MAESDHDVSSLERLRISSGIMGRIAHDFNNLLTPLLAYPQLIEGALPEDSTARELVQVVEKTAHDMLHITRELLMLSSDLSGETASLDISALINQALTQVMDAHGEERLARELELLEQAPQVTGSAEYLVCALTHLINNAAEAVLESEKGRGSILVRSTVVNVDAMTGSCGARIEAGRYMRIDICDDGDGIPAEVEGRVFEPFVTTRKSSERRGAGLGLSIACKIIAEQQGCICVGVEEGWTVFSVYLPIALQDATSGDEGGAAGQDRYEAAEPGEEALDASAILLVDDEATIRKLFKMILGTAFKDKDFELVENGAEALEAFKKRRHGVILMDLHMPVMDGQVAFREIMKTCDERGWAKPSVLFCSGFTPSEGLRDIVAANPRHGLLAKPVRNQVLIDEVSKRLGPGSEAA